MQQTIDVVEDVFLGYFGAITFPAAFQNEVGDAILARVFLVTSVKKRCLIGSAFVIVVKREALSATIGIKISNYIGNMDRKIFYTSNTRNTNN